MASVVGSNPYLKYEPPPGVSITPDMVQSISGQESDAGLVDYTMIEPDPINDIDLPERRAALAKNMIYHPVEKNGQSLRGEP